MPESCLKTLENMPSTICHQWREPVCLIQLPKSCSNSRYGELDSRPSTGFFRGFLRGFTWCSSRNWAGVTDKRPFAFGLIRQGGVAKHKLLDTQATTGSGCGIRPGLLLHWLFVVFMLTIPDISAGLLGERVFNARSISSKVRTLIQLCVLFFDFGYNTSRLTWKLNRERLAGPMPSVIGYAISAFAPPLRYLYNEVWFTAMVIVVSFFWQMAIQFSGTVGGRWRRHRTKKQMRRAVETAGDDNEATCALLRTQLEGDLKRFQPLVTNFLNLTRQYRLSRTQTLQNSLFKDDLAELENVFKDCLAALPEQESQSTYAQNRSSKPDTLHDKDRPKEPIVAKVAVFCVAVVISFVSTFAFVGSWFAFAQTFNWGVTAVLLIGIKVARPHQTIEDMLNLFSNFIGGSLFTLLLVSIPTLVDKRTLDNDITFTVIVVVLTLLSVTCSDMIAPGVVALLVVCRVVKKEHVPKSMWNVFPFTLMQRPGEESNASEGADSHQSATYEVPETNEVNSGLADKK